MKLKKFFGIIVITLIAVPVFITCNSSNTHIHTPGAAASCTEAQTCTVCGEVLQAKLPHTPGKAATCITVQTCTVCNEVIATATGQHAPGTTSTCIADKTCTVCGEVLQAAAGHTPGSEETCRTAQTCTVCGEVLAAATGQHTFANGFCTLCDSIEEMVQISAGVFLMGPESFYNHNTTFTVTISAFKMSKYQVTQEQYQTVMEENPSYFHGGAGRAPDADEVQEKRPVENVTWYKAIEFCNKLSEREGLTPVYTINGTTVTPDWTSNGYRLPTEAEWEYACRAGSTSSNWHFGDMESELGKYAWYKDSSGYKTHQVGMKLQNDFGLFDMHGNVQEWCWDWLGHFPAGPEEDYIGAASGDSRVYRGGSFISVAYKTRSASRDGYAPSNASSINGLRIVCP